MASPPSRRSLLKRGALGGAVLLAGSSLPVIFRPSGPLAPPTRPLVQLTAVEYGIFAAIAARVVLGTARTRAGRPRRRWIAPASSTRS